MGAYAPTPLCSNALLQEISKKVLQPTVDGMRREGRPYVGVIYAGILFDTKTGTWKIPRKILKFQESMF
jgi:phosphoribosylamine--glycine ligase/phosphoribosylformylglycinamidine cyclo-ligase